MSFPVRVFSGLQPTGVPHLGNYLGALKGWVALQSAPPALPAGPPAASPSTPPVRLYSIVDWHAMTVPYTPSALPSAVETTAAILLALGLDPSSSILYRQSAVREHTELAWLLSCVAHLGPLRRMAQFKDKGDRGGDAGSVLGLLSYPVLQAADILLHRATHVPVGEDQFQHLELARTLASASNARAVAGGLPPLFPLPATLPPPAATGLRIMSLTRPTTKMSKSDPDAASRIDLTDAPDVVAAKLKRAVTDSVPGFSGLDAPGREGKRNLLGIMAALSGQSRGELEQRYATSPAAEFKRDLTDLVVHELAPLQARLQAVTEGGGVARVLADGAERAAESAGPVMADVRAAFGYK